jgi:hypothetical protein
LFDEETPVVVDVDADKDYYPTFNDDSKSA